MAQMNASLKARLGDNAPFIALIALYLLIEIAQPTFLAPSTQLGLLADSSTLFIMAAGTTFVVLLGNASLGWTTGSSFGIPHEIMLALVVFLLCVFLHRSTVFGRRVDAIGAGEPAAIASGVRVPVTRCLVFATSSLFAGLAGVIMAGRLGSGSPTLADQFLLPAIAAVIVGGTALTGGAGGIGRTLIGALLVSVARVGMTFVGISVFAQQIVFGVILIVAVTVAFDRSKVLIIK
jgi:ribose transport system permease protein